VSTPPLPEAWLISINSFCEKVPSRQSLRFYSVLDTLRSGHPRVFLVVFPFQGGMAVPSLSRDGTGFYLWGRVTYVALPYLSPPTPPPDHTTHTSRTTMHATQTVHVMRFFFYSLGFVDRGFLSCVSHLQRLDLDLLYHSQMDYLQLGCGQCTIRTNHPSSPSPNPPSSATPTPTYTCSHLHFHNPRSMSMNYRARDRDRSCYFSLFDHFLILRWESGWLWIFLGSCSGGLAWVWFFFGF
jgi:hypothetical protein